MFWFDAWVLGMNDHLGKSNTFEGNIPGEG